MSPREIAAGLLAAAAQNTEWLGSTLAVLLRMNAQSYTDENILEKLAQAEREAEEAIVRLRAARTFFERRSR